MKNKKGILFLIVSVAAVWGLIFYKVFTATGAEDTYSLPVAHTSVAYESLDDYKLQDTDVLQLNYPDPFLKAELQTLPVVTAEPEKANSAPGAFFSARQSTAKPQVNWPEISFIGTIQNAENKRRISLMKVNGKEHMLKEGDWTDGVRLLKNLRDSVLISYQQKTKFIKLQ